MAACLVRLIAYGWYGRIKTMNPTQTSVLFSSEILRNPSIQTQFSGFLKEARRLGMDVNDWIEQKEGWPEALPILNKAVFPYLKEGSSVCELGAGTGRFARHIIKRIKKGKLILADNNVWVVSFLSEYFKGVKNIGFCLNDGQTLKGIKSSSIDLIFCNGTFIELNLGLFYLYSREFYRVLKKGGYCIFDYFDTGAAKTWDHIKKYSGRYPGCFSYHNPDIIDKIFVSAGLRVTRRLNINHSTYIIIKKP